MLQLQDYLITFKDYITNEVLADTLTSENGLEGFKEELNIGDYKCIITVKKVV